MTKRFALDISEDNAVSFKDINDGKVLLYLEFDTMENAVKCKDALKYQCNLMNTLYVDNTTKQIQIDFLQDENKHMKNVLDENKKLKKALWEAETEYIHERYYDNPIREEESINELKKDFKRGYWND